ncbi:unnamed protein product [Prorocentrum cordatum]|uniref:Uncharacterized protein n=1 Tax=Prorocentrum cordatum TaxID=2364126 RepID=A0ABN9QMY4_9DINO|nr:unnamed protein product [Polarella glacialis]
MRCCVSKWTQSLLSTLFQEWWRVMRRKVLKNSCTYDRCFDAWIDFTMFTLAESDSERSIANTDRPEVLVTRAAAGAADLDPRCFDARSLEMRRLPKGDDVVSDALSGELEPYVMPALARSSASASPPPLSSFWRPSLPPLPPIPPFPLLFPNSEDTSSFARTPRTLAAASSVEHYSQMT